MIINSAIFYFMPERLTLKILLQSQKFILQFTNGLYIVDFYCSNWSRVLYRPTWQTDYAESDQFPSLQPDMANKS